MTSTQKISFSKSGGPEKALQGWIRVGTWQNAPLWHGANGFYLDPFSKKPAPLDPYEIGAELYEALKAHYGMSHKEMAEMLGISQRTAEGMALGRVSQANRLKLSRLAATVQSSNLP